MVKQKKLSKSTSKQKMFKPKKSEAVNNKIPSLSLQITQSAEELQNA